MASIYMVKGYEELYAYAHTALQDITQEQARLEGMLAEIEAAIGGANSPLADSARRHVANALQALQSTALQLGVAIRSAQDAEREAERFLADAEGWANLQAASGR